MDSAVATVRGSFWISLSHFAGRLIMFLCTIILSRLLSTEEFGVAGYAIVTISLLDVLTDLGIGSALIYYRDDPHRIQSGFWLGLAIGLSLFGLAWTIAPLAAHFFHDPRATSVIRTLAFVFPILSLSNVHDSLLRKELEFGRKMIPDVLRALSKGLFSIFFALLGFGAFSLIYGYIAGTAVAVIAYWLNHPWRPSFRFRFVHTRQLLSYGMGIVSVNAMAALIMNVDYLLVGHYIGVVALGVYTLSFRIPELLIKEFCGNVGKVVFPVYAKIRNDLNLLSEGFLAALRYITMFTIPAALGLALIARPFVLTLFSEKWSAAIPVIPAISLYTLFRSLTFNAGDVYKAQGRIKLLNKISLLQAAILLPALWWAVVHYRSITAVAWTQAIVAFVGVLIKITVTSRILKLPLRMFFSAIEPAVISASFMCVAVAGTLYGLAHVSNPVQLITAVLVGGTVYFSSLWFLRRDVMITAGNTLRMALVRR
jgi:O-antigen/teichoic acid export membrane protein